MTDTTYNYTITSATNDGATSVTGSGSLTSATQDITGIDVSALPDGILTYSVTLTDASGNTGPAATATTILDTGTPVGYTITPDQGQIGPGQATATGFTFVGATTGTTYTYTITSSGDNGATSVTGSGSVTSATQDITGIDVSGLPDGQLTYSVALTDADGNTGTAATANATLAAETAPAVTVQPVAETVTLGGTATFTAAASGDPTPTVQWMVSSDGGASFSDVSGATAATYSFTPTAGQNGDEYEAVFSNAGGSATTTAATLTIQTAPAVTAQPAAETVIAGGTATFTAAASGDPAPSVQWMVSSNGGASFSDVSGATSTTYSFTPSIGQNGDEYEAVFSNGAGSATTTAVTLTVQAAPAVTAQPTAETVIAGGTATFTATASGNPAPSVQWMVSSDGGASFSDVSGATSTTYSFAPTTAQSGDQYEAVFTNSLGSATSTAVSLTVQAAPAVTVQPIAQTVTAGGTATFAAAASGNPAPSVQWLVSSDGGASFSAINGATAATYSVAPTLAQNGDEYEAVFSNAAGNATSTAVTLAVQAAPAVTTQPAAQTVVAGDVATFTAAASGNPAPGVQWMVSTDSGATFSDISGATSTTYSFTPTTAQSGDQYEAVFTNSLGAATSTAATLTVQAASTGTLSGFVYYDGAGFGNFSLQLMSVDSQGNLSAVSSDPSAPIQSDGSYSFSGLAAGTYQIQVPSSVTAELDMSSNEIQVVLAAGQTSSGNNFTVYGPQMDLVSLRMFLASSGLPAEYLTHLIEGNQSAPA